MKETPLVSVIVPTHARPAALARCLRSLCAQDYPSFEIVVVDDGGDLPARAAQTAVAGAVPLTVLRQRNSGPAAARNLGASAAGGEVLAFTDDDCLPSPSWLSTLARHCSTKPAVGAGGRMVNLLGDQPYARVAQAVVDTGLETLNADPHRARFLTGSNLALPANGFREIGGFDPAFRTAEDRDICDRWNSAGMRLEWVRNAVVGHAHSLHGRTFLSVHFAYGRGAFRFHRARASRAGRARLGMSFIDPAYYRAIARLPLASGGIAEATSTAARLALWQGANVAGFAAAALSDGPGSQRPAGRSAG